MQPFSVNKGGIKQKKIFCEQSPRIPRVSYLPFPWLVRYITRTWATDKLRRSVVASFQLVPVGKTLVMLTLLAIIRGISKKRGRWRNRGGVGEEFDYRICSPGQRIIIDWCAQSSSASSSSSSSIVGFIVITGAVVFFDDQSRPTDKGGSSSSYSRPVLDPSHISGGCCRRAHDVECERVCVGVYWGWTRQWWWWWTPPFLTFHS